MTRLQTLSIAVDSLAAGGDGVGRDSQGRVTFVPHSAPGDALEVTLTRANRSFARGRIEQIRTPSPYRVEPLCSLFVSNQCGGCCWQHVEYKTQAQAKQQIVRAALRNLIRLGLEIESIQTPVSPYRWRRRARLHWERAPTDAHATIGYYQANSNRLIDVETCLQLEPMLETALDQIRSKLSAYLKHKGEIHLVVGHQKEVHVVLDGPCNPKHAQTVLGEPIVGISVANMHYGHIPALDDEFPCTANQFCQASSGGNQALRTTVDRLTLPREGSRILELYAGSGNLTRTLVRGAFHITAVEQSLPRHIRSLRHDRITFVQGDALTVTHKMVRSKRPVDLVVLDPPRQGARSLMPLLASLKPKRIVYVSCNPATLARDTTTLVEQGYIPTVASPLDLMPQTPHIEVVVQLNLHDGGGKSP